MGSFRFIKNWADIEIFHILLNPHSACLETKLSSRVAVSFYIPTSKEWEYLFLYFLPTFCGFFCLFAIEIDMKQYLIVVLEIESFKKIKMKNILKDGLVVSYKTKYSFVI